ncbi:Aromatic amino acid aminotransferase 2 [Nakaseomyces bracarensis]|uniref:Aromatic amino acid aminotransferase 2 n=1 Tax=Nakaseomyces bracarensis TaxID=273131 RepID=A0ABR4NN50_9SACH
MLADLEKKYASFLSKRMEHRRMVKFWDDEVLGDDVIELTAGMPNEQFFPIKAIDMTIVNKPFESDHDTSKHMHARMSTYEPKSLPIARSFQYNEVEGLPQLRSFIRYLVNKINKPAYSEEDWEVLLSSGSCDSMFKFFECFCDESSTVLMEEFTFSPVISHVRATGAECIPLKMNLTKDPKTQGIDVDYLTDLLENWETGPYKKHNKPRVLYTICTGQNPTGVTIPVENRKKIYALAQKHDFLILEDDPYGYLSFPAYNSENPMKNDYLEENFTIEKYVNDFLVDSFLTIDTDARVVRMETFSKVFSPGLRLGFLVGNKFIINNLLEYAEITTRAPSGVSQAVLYSTLETLAEYQEGDNREDKAVVHEALFKGWMHWIMKVASEYTHRRNITLKAMYETEAYKKGYFTVVEPSAGMFVGVKVKWDHAPKKPENIPEEMKKLDRYLVKNGIKTVLGYRMGVCTEFSHDNSDFLRVTIAYARDDNQLVEASHRIGTGIEEFFKNM